MKNLLIPIGVIVIPLGFIVFLSAWLKIDIGWASMTLGLTGVLIYFDAASRFNEDAGYARWYLGAFDRKDKVKTLGWTYLFVILGYVINAVGGDVISFLRVLFVVSILSIYVLLYAMSWRYLENENQADKRLE